MNRLVYGHAGPNPPVPPLSPEAEALKEEGNALFKAGDFDAAREKYSAALEQAVSRFSPGAGGRYASRPRSLMLPVPPPRSRIISSSSGTEPFPSCVPLPPIMKQPSPTPKPQYG